MVFGCKLGDAFRMYKIQSIPMTKEQESNRDRILAAHALKTNGNQSQIKSLDLRSWQHQMLAICCGGSYEYRVHFNPNPYGVK